MIFVTFMVVATLKALTFVTLRVVVTFSHFRVEMCYFRLVVAVSVDFCYIEGGCCI